MIHTEDNLVRVNYPLNFTEEQVQGMINELKALDLNKINSIYLETDDIALSLVFYFKELIQSKELDITIYVRPPVNYMLVQNFKEVFGSDKLKVQYE